MDDIVSGSNQKATLSVLDQLREITTVVADTGDFGVMQALKPIDATTNPSLILQAVEKPEYQALVDSVIAASSNVDDAQDRLCIAFGCEILKLIPGRVSTEVDAHLSFDTQASYNKAKQLMALYAEAGVEPERVLIKLASTWEGIQTARLLEADGIHCNLTLLFGMGQAVACGQAGVTLISPFVGRIMDWYSSKTGQQYTGSDDPGVQSVTRIYRYFKQQGFNTTVMGASFRNVGEIIELAGCDALTISPALLDELDAMQTELQPRLTVQSARDAEAEMFPELNERQFRWLLNEDEMATEKLAEGIRKFSIDQRKLADLVSQRMR